MGRDARLNGPLLVVTCSTWRGGPLRSGPRDNGQQSRHEHCAEMPAGTAAAPRAVGRDRDRALGAAVEGSAACAAVCVRTPVPAATVIRGSPHAVIAHCRPVGCPKPHGGKPFWR